MISPQSLNQKTKSEPLFLLNHQESDSMISDTKFAADAGTNYYDRSLTSRKWALVGLACSSIFSCLCIVSGIVIVAKYGPFGVAVTDMTNSYASISQAELLILSLTPSFIVMLCTESIGFVHGTALRFALASESRLHFNTNLRFLTAARGWYNPNGTLLNAISAALLIISYSSASLVISIDWLIIPMSLGYFTSGGNTAFTGLALLILGIALLLQVMIAISGIRAVKIATWSSSPFDLTAALVHHTQLTPTTLRCMRCVSDLDTDEGPVKPSKIQPSAWHAHPSIRKVIISLWMLVAVCAGWAALVTYFGNKKHDAYPDEFDALTLQTWSFFSLNTTVGITYNIPGGNREVWILLFINMAVVQGPLTLGLHCSELIVNVIRDERQWRSATRRRGLRTTTNPVKAIFTNPICLVLFIAKPFLHWMFGLSFTIPPNPANGQLVTLKVFMYTAQIWNLCIALFIFVCFFTFVALRRPRGPQPATYGHLQTLANLVDEWSPEMWWGHKEDGIPYCHAGTSDHPLPDVKMDCVYAGSGAGSLIPLS